MVKITSGTSLQRHNGEVTEITSGVRFEFDDGTFMDVEPLKSEDGIAVSVSGGWKSTFVVRPIVSNVIQIIPIMPHKPIAQGEP